MNPRVLSTRSAPRHEQSNAQEYFLSSSWSEAASERARDFLSMRSNGAFPFFLVRSSRSYLVPERVRSRYSPVSPRFFFFLLLVLTRVFDQAFGSIGVLVIVSLRSNRRVSIALRNRQYDSDSNGRSSLIAATARENRHPSSRSVPRGRVSRHVVTHRPLEANVITRPAYETERATALRSRGSISLGGSDSPNGRSRGSSLSIWRFLGHRTGLDRSPIVDRTRLIGYVIERTLGVVSCRVVSRAQHQPRARNWSRG